MSAEFAVTVSYGQIIAYLRHLDRPGLLWTQEHVDQGFAWNPGLVGFGVPDHDGECWVELLTKAADADLRVEASLWAIEVPFDAVEPGICVGTVLDTRPFTVDTGSYRVIFEAHPAEQRAGTDYTYVLRLLFIPSDEQTFAILKQGPLESNTVLTRTAERA